MPMWLHRHYYWRQLSKSQISTPLPTHAELNALADAQANTVARLEARIAQLEGDKAAMGARLTELEATAAATLQGFTTLFAAAHTDMSTAAPAAGTDAAAVAVAASARPPANALEALFRDDSHGSAVAAGSAGRTGTGIGPAAGPQAGPPAAGSRARRSSKPVARGAARPSPRRTRDGGRRHRSKNSGSWVFQRAPGKYYADDEFGTLGTLGTLGTADAASHGSVRTNPTLKGLWKRVGSGGGTVS